MRETCEVVLEPGRLYGVAQRFSFVAAEGGEGGIVVARSDPFLSVAGFVVRSGNAQTRHRELLHRLALDGWQAWGGGENTRGRAWYAHRLYR